MTKPAYHQPLTLGVYAISRGFGWIAFEGPFSAYDWGLAFVRGNKNADSMRRLERLLERLQPETLVLEIFAPKVRRANRVIGLHQAMTAAALNRGVEIASYSRTNIQECFSTVGARTRQEIAEAVARQIDALSHRVPRKRGAWHAEDRRMALFNAAALVLTHYHFGANKFFEGLMDAA